MRIQFSEIPDNGLRLKVNDEAWFPDQEVARAGPVAAAVFLERKGAARVLLEGEIEAAIVLDCARCLEPFTKRLAGGFKVDLEYIEPGLPLPEEHSCSASEMDTMYLAEPVVDIYEVLSQQVLLSLPVKAVCSETCRGLCPRCGTNLNKKPCSCPTDTSSSPFSKLASLKKK